MRPQITVPNRLGCDTSWITQDLIERYVAARLKSESYSERVLAGYCTDNPARYKLFFELIVSQVEELEELENSLLDEFGEEAFFTKKTKAKLLRHMHERLEAETDNEVAVKIFDGICKAEGWYPKPDSAPQTVVDITNINGTHVFDKTKPAECEKVYMAIAGAAIVR